MAGGQGPGQRGRQGCGVVWCHVPGQPCCGHGHRDRLAGALAGVLLDTYPGFPVYAPRQIFADPAVAIADGADAVTGIEVLRRREALFGAVAPMALGMAAAGPDR